MKRWRVGRRAVLLVCAMLCVLLGEGGPAYALEDPAQKILRENAERQAVEQLERGPSSARTEGTSLAPGVSSFCFPIERLVLSGNTRFSQDEIVSGSSLKVPACLGQKEIEAFLTHLSGLYRGQGYITTQVVVPPQDLKSKRLRIEIIEGRVEAITHHITDVDGHRHRAPRSRTQSLFPSLSGNILNLREIEQGVWTLTRLPSQRAQVDLAPGTAIGGTHVILEETEVSVPMGKIEVDNFGRLGASRLGLEYTFVNLFDRNDQWSVYYAGGRQDNALVGQVSVPHGRWIFEGVLSFSEQLAFLSQNADSFTENFGAHLGASVLLFRNHRWVVRAHETLGYSKMKRWVGALPLAGYTSFWGRTAIGVEGYFSNFRIIAQTGIVANVQIINDGQETEEDGETTLKWDGSVTALYALGWEVTGSVVLAYQVSPFSLPSQQAFSLGGWSSVRGTSQTDFSGDNGVMARLEFQKPVTIGVLKSALSGGGGAVEPPPSQDAAPSLGALDWLVPGVSVYTFMDGGLVHTHGDPHPQGMLSAGMGARLFYRRLSVDAAVAHSFRELFLEKRSHVEMGVKVSYAF